VEIHSRAAQRRKFAQLLVEGKISAQTYEEWNRETGKRTLPEKVGKKTPERQPRGPRRSGSGVHTAPSFHAPWRAGRSTGTFDTAAAQFGSQGLRVLPPSAGSGCTTPHREGPCHTCAHVCDQRAPRDGAAPMSSASRRTSGSWMTVASNMATPGRQVASEAGKGGIGDASQAGQYGRRDSAPTATSG
jgi:hypothetical protein